MKTKQGIVQNNQVPISNKQVVQKSVVKKPVVKAQPRPTMQPRPVAKVQPKRVVRKVKPKAVKIVAQKKGRKPITLFFHLSNRDKMFFARRMEMMLRTGMQVLDSLIKLREQTQNPSFVKVLDQAILDVKSGQFLHVSLGRHKEKFGEFFINVIKVGEVSGTLADSFKYLAEELKKKQELASKIKGAMIYPAVILVATVGMTALLIFFIFPKVIPIFESMNVELPLVTVILIVIAETLLNYGVFIFAGLVALGVSFWLILRIPKMRMLWHKSFLLVPFVNKLIIAVNVISFARTMALLLKSGVKIVEALTITGDTLANRAYRKEIIRTSARVREGGTIAEHLATSPRYFPKVFSQMIEVGEDTGTLGESAIFLASFYEEELDTSTKALSTILEPLLLVGMGLAVSFVALAILLPIFQITSSVGR